MLTRREALRLPDRLEPRGPQKELELHNTEDRAGKMLVWERWSKTLLRWEHNRISQVWKVLLSSVSSLESAENIPASGLKDKIYV